MKAEGESTELQLEEVDHRRAAGNKKMVGASRRRAAPRSQSVKRRAEARRWMS